MRLFSESLISFTSPDVIMEIVEVKRSFGSSINSHEFFSVGALGERSPLEDCEEVLRLNKEVLEVVEVVLRVSEVNGWVLGVIERVLRIFDKFFVFSSFKRGH